MQHYKKQEYSKSEAAFRESLRQGIDFKENDKRIANSFSMLGWALYRQNKMPQAEEAIRKAIYIAERSNVSNDYLAECYQEAILYATNSGNMKEVEKIETRLLKYHKEHVTKNAYESYNLIAWRYATFLVVRFRNGKKAVDYAITACKLSNWKNPIIIDTLAAAYAEKGDL